MSTIQIAAIIVSLAAGLAYLNARFLRLPSAIGLMAIALAGSLVLVGLDGVHLIDASHVRRIVDQADFGDTLLHGMLGLLLFAGALHVDLQELAAQRWMVGGLALGATLLSTALIGGAVYLGSHALGAGLGAIDACLFGALISPTDPIAVLGLLRSAKAPAEIAVQIGGESLFNDGIGVVIFIVVLAVGAGGEISAGHVAEIFAHEALGGGLFGLAVGYLGFRLLRSIDDYSVEVLITLAMVLGGYAAAEAIGVSAPIAAVVAGLVVGNQGRRLAMSDQTRLHVDMFWKLIDEILNAVLFLLLGLEATRLVVSAELATLAALAIPVALFARWLSVVVTVTLLRPVVARTPGAVTILTWGGLRGGISVALALSLPPGPAHDPILMMTYAVVAFSILVQGLTLPRYLRTRYGTAPAHA